MDFTWGAAGKPVDCSTGFALQNCAMSCCEVWGKSRDIAPWVQKNPATTGRPTTSERPPTTQAPAPAGHVTEAATTEAATTVAATTQVATTRAPEPSGPTTMPFNCQYGLQEWQLVWPKDKADYCCEHEKLGCPTDPNKDRDCTLWWTDIELSWGHEKRGWCCEHENKGCPTTTTIIGTTVSAAIFDCNFGLEHWDLLWSKD